MSAPAIEIRGLTKSFRNFTLGPLDLTVPAGALYGFVGPNGSGKTTTMDLIFGMGAKDEGSITVLGCDHLRDEVAMKRQVAYVSPELNFQPWARVGRAIDFVRGFHPSWDPAYCQRLLEAFRLRPDERIRALSFGARIKLALVLALSWRPALLVLDEPTVGLDAIAKREVFAELLSAVTDEGRTVFISSHGIADLERFADHVGMIRHGQLVFEGSTADVADRFRVLDLIADSEPRFARGSGFTVQHRDGNRFRVLLDRQTVTTDWRGLPGMQLIAEAPVSLEDLFIALGRS